MFVYIKKKKIDEGVLEKLQKTTSMQEDEGSVPTKNIEYKKKEKTGSGESVLINSQTSGTYHASNSNVTIPEELDEEGKGKTTLSREEERELRKEHSLDEKKVEINLVPSPSKRNENNVSKLSPWEKELIVNQKRKDLYMAEFHEDFFTQILDEKTFGEIKLKYEYMNDLIMLTQLTQQVQDIFAGFIVNLKRYLEENYYKSFLESEFFLRRITKLSLLRYKQSMSYNKPVFSDLKRSSINVLPNKMLNSSEFNTDNMMSLAGSTFSMNASRKRMVSTVCMPNYLSSYDFSAINPSASVGLSRVNQSENNLGRLVRSEMRNEKN